jgi:hypothetical protein
MWKQSTQDDFDWSRGKATPSGSTGPGAAADGTYFLFIETSSPRKNGDAAFLSATGLSVENAASLSFKYNMYGADCNKLAVSILGNPKTTPFVKQGAQEKDLLKNRDWSSATIDLSAYAGQTIGIEIEATRGPNYRGDIAIDALELDHGLSSATPTAAQTSAPVPMPTASPTTLAPAPAPTHAPTTLAPMHTPTVAPTAAQTSTPVTPASPGNGSGLDQAVADITKEIKSVESGLNDIEAKVQALSAR